MVRPFAPGLGRKRDMPKIAATAVMLVLVAAAIGLNMTRYPTVWQMGAPPSPSSQPEEAARPSDAAHSAGFVPAPTSDKASAPKSSAATPPAGETQRRPTMTLPVSSPATNATPTAATHPQPTDAAVESFVEPLAEYRRQRDANGTAAAVHDAPPAATAPSSTPPPAASQPPAAMSKEWPAEAAASPRVVASPVPPKSPEPAKKAEGKQGDGPVVAEAKAGTVAVPVTEETVERLTPVVRPASVSTAPAAGSDNTIRPLPPLDPSGVPPPVAPAPGVLKPVYPSTGVQ
jgi:hypothetical protein